MEQFDIAALAAQPGVPDRQKRAPARRIRRTRGDLSFKLHAACGGHGRSVAVLPTEEQMSDHKGAPVLPPSPNRGWRCKQRLNELCLDDLWQRTQAERLEAERIVLAVPGPPPPFVGLSSYRHHATVHQQLRHIFRSKRQNLPPPAPITGSDSRDLFPRFNNPHDHRNHLAANHASEKP